MNVSAACANPDYFSVAPAAEFSNDREASGTGFQRSIDLTGPAGRLEAVLTQGTPNAPFAALVCHPHPLGGGTMHNKVVYHAMKVFNGEEWGFRLPVLRFNFRGVGLSQGAYDGESEVDDVESALAWLENTFKLPILAAGFSFGAAMTLKACCGGGRVRENIHSVTALGLPAEAEGRKYDYPFLGDCTLPKLFLSGDHDQFAPAERLLQISDYAAGPKQLVLVPGANHFFAGQIKPMQQALAGWLKEQIG